MIGRHILEIKASYDPVKSGSGDDLGAGDRAFKSPRPDHSFQAAVVRSSGDSTSNGNTGTNTGEVVFGGAGRIGTSATLNGTSSYINAPHHASLNPTAAVTVSACVKRSTNGEAYPIVLCKENSAYCVHLQNTDEVAFWMNGGGNKALTSSADLDTTSWY